MGRRGAGGSAVNEPEGLQGEGYPVQFTHQMFEDEKIHGYASANIKVREPLRATAGACRRADCRC